MDEFKFKPLEDWLQGVRQGDHDNFIAMAVNKNHQLRSVASCKAESMLEMLLTCADKNEAFRDAIMAATSIIAKKMKEEGKAQKKSN